jgi:hypothetical protein
MTLMLVCSRSWMRDEFASAGIDLRHSYGLDVPDMIDVTSWWMPQGYAVSLNRALELNGVPPVRLTAPEATFLNAIADDIRGREVLTFDLADALSRTDLDVGWWKFATAKVEDFPAQVMTHTDFVGWMLAHDIPLSSVVQYTPTTLDIAREYRTFVRYGEVVASSIYLEHTAEGGVTVYDGAITNEGEQAFIPEFIASALLGIDIPDGFVVDVAFLTDGTPIVLEANPAWCSAWYNCDITAVVATIEASFADPKHDYAPDPYLVHREQGRRPLQLAPNLPSF